MIARSWDGPVAADRADTYFDYLLRTGVPGLQGTAGNLGVYVLRRIEGERATFLMISFWGSRDDIRAFAGDDIERARYYPEDRAFLLRVDPRVEHHEVLVAHRAKEEVARRGKAEVAQRGRVEAARGRPIARVWHGVVPAEKAEAYGRYLSDSNRGVRDYQALAGYRAVYLMRRPEGKRCHFLLLSEWDSRQAIAAYAGDDIERARYFDVDRECLIDPEPHVKHFEVLVAPGAPPR